MGGDIRAQLPEEAKKFDLIDRNFKKVYFSLFSTTKLSFGAIFSTKKIYSIFSAAK